MRCTTRHGTARYEFVASFHGWHAIICEWHRRLLESFSACSRTSASTTSSQASSAGTKWWHKHSTTQRATITEESSRARERERDGESGSGRVNSLAVDKCISKVCLRRHAANCCSCCCSCCYCMAMPECRYMLSVSLCVCVWVSMWQARANTSGKAPRSADSARVAEFQFSLAQHINKICFIIFPP